MNNKNPSNDENSNNKFEVEVNKQIEEEDKEFENEYIEIEQYLKSSTISMHS